MSHRYTILILTPVLAISLMLLVLGGAAAWTVHRFNKDVSDLLHEHVVCTLASEKLVAGIIEMHDELAEFAATQDLSHLLNARDASLQNEQQLKALNEIATTSTAQQSIVQLTEAQQQVSATIQAALRMPPPQAAEHIAARTGQRSGLHDPARELLEYNRRAAERESDRNKSVADGIGRGLMLLGICGAVAGLISGFGIARGLSRSLVQLSVPIRDTAGKLNEVVGPITVHGRAGFPELESMLRTIAGETSAVVQRLQESQQEAMRSEKFAALGQLAAGLAHELRNPLMSMKILVQACSERGPQSAITGRDLSVLEQEITRLEHLIQGFLDFARPPRPEKRRMDLRAVVEQTVHLVSGRAAQQGVELVSDAQATPLWIDADAGQIRQVLLNLLLNALDASPDGGSIVLQTTQDTFAPQADAPDTGTSAAVLRIADSGGGLPEDLGQRIFEPFVSTKETGLGLGLSVCKRIVEDHQGVITAEDRPQGGALFTVHLPMSTDRDAAADDSSPRASLLAANQPSGSGAHQGEA